MKANISRAAALLLPLAISIFCHPQVGSDLKFDIHAVDSKADPCVDFYQYACGGWLARNPVPPDRSVSAVYSQMQDLNQRRVAGMLESAAESGSSRPAGENKIGDYYAACIDEVTIEAKGFNALQPELARIAALHNLADLADEVARLHRLGTDVLFSMGADQELQDSSRVIAYLDQSGLSLPEPGFYTVGNAEMSKVRAAYRSHLETEFKLLGHGAPEAAAAADEVLQIEVRLAGAELTPVERRDRKSWYHEMSMVELRQLAPEFAWERYFSAVGYSGKGEMNVAVPKYMQTLNQLLRETSLEAWKNYLRWELLRAATPALPARFRAADFDFYGRTMEEQAQPRARKMQCVALTNRDLGEAVGQQYVKLYFPPESKQRVVEMVRRIREAMRQDFLRASWISPRTRQEAIHKLEMLRVMIGYPDHWRDYSRLDIKRDDALGNGFRSQEFEFLRQMAKVGRPVDRDEFYELPQGVEGYHDNPLNVVVFTAGILQPPFFDPQMDDAINFGLAGAVIGHEITHAFDDAGHRFDGAGNLRNWWTTEDSSHYVQRAACFVRQYSKYTVVGDVKVNGELTLGENIADNGGLSLAFKAFLDQHEQADAAPSIDGYSARQRFFLGWAQWRCMNITEKKARELARTDGHSPGRWRVNGVVSNMPGFARAYHCKIGDAMARAEPCQVW